MDFLRWGGGGSCGGRSIKRRPGSKARCDLLYPCASGPNGELMERMVTEKRSSLWIKRFANSTVDTRWPRNATGTNTSSAFFIAILSCLVSSSYFSPCSDLLRYIFPANRLFPPLLTLTWRIVLGPHNCPMSSHHTNSNSKLNDKIERWIIFLWGTM